MRKLLYSVRHIGLSLLVILGFIWLSHLTLSPETPRTEPSSERPATAVSPPPVGQQETPAPQTGHPVALKAVKDEITALRKQQRADLATLQQQQNTVLAALRQRLDRLFAEQRSLTQQFNDITQLAAHSSDASLTQDNTGAIDVEHTADQVAQTHASQAVDSAWSAQAETAIGQSFSRFSQELPPGAVLLDTECRTTICRIAVAFETEATRDEVFRLLPHLIPWNADGLLHLDDATQTVVFYAAREGETLAEAR